MSAPKIELDIEYHTPTTLKDGARFGQAAKWLVQRFSLKKLNASISIVDDSAIHRLNREHLQHDWPTDVISFVFENADGVVDGEIIASADTAARVAKEAGWSAEDELLLYVIHGLLHLVGLDDISTEDRQLMRATEQECLIALAVPAAARYLDRWNSISY